MLGPVRDLDVLIDHLGDEVSRLDADEPAGRSLLTALGAEREARRTELIDALDSNRYLELPLVIRRGDRAGGDARPPAPGAGELAERAVRRVRKAVSALPKTPSDEELHALRKTAKRARYAVELAGLNGGKAEGAGARGVSSTSRT